MSDDDDDEDDDDDDDDDDQDDFDEDHDPACRNRKHLADGQDCEAAKPPAQGCIDLCFEPDGRGGADGQLPLRGADDFLFPCRVLVPHEMGRIAFSSIACAVDREQIIARFDLPVSGAAAGLGTGNRLWLAHSCLLRSVVLVLAGR